MNRLHRRQGVSRPIVDGNRTSVRVDTAAVDGDAVAPVGKADIVAIFAAVRATNKGNGVRADLRQGVKIAVNRARKANTADSAVDAAEAVVAAIAAKAVAVAAVTVVHVPKVSREAEQSNLTLDRRRGRGSSPKLGANPFRIPGIFDQTVN